jgi:hypothetical protein
MYRTFVLMLAAVVSLPLFAGGFYLEFGSPTAKVKDSIAVVRPTGCHEPHKAQLTAVAEGVVAGVRKSVPLTLVPVDAAAGVYAIKREFPAEGKWVITIVATESGRMTSAMLPVSSEGVDRKAVKHFPNERVSAKEIARVLSAD